MAEVQQYPCVEWITDDGWLYVNNGAVTEVGDAVFAG